MTSTKFHITVTKKKQRINRVNFTVTEKSEFFFWRLTEHYTQQLHANKKITFDIINEERDLA